MARCYDEKDSSYHNYGGRGIKVSRRWHDFSAFVEDMGDRPQGTTLDRIDNNKDYSLANCKWSSKKEQSRNTRRNVIIRYNGRVATLTEFAESYGLPPKTLWARLNRGMDLHEALNRPLRKAHATE